jgi:hypothetical protein
LNLKLTIATAAWLAAGAAQADTVTQWTFNGPQDETASTGTLLPAVGSGSAGTLGMSATFASGNASGGSSDPETTNNDSGWNLTGFAAQGTGNASRGAQFQVSTVGWQDVEIRYDLRHSNTAPAHELLQYTLDGVNYQDLASFAATSGDTWFNGRSASLASVAGADHNPLFGFRVVAAFGPAGQYLPSTPTSSFGTSGTWRFDMVTVMAAPVPEPSTYALLLAGALVIGLQVRSRQR